MRLGSPKNGREDAYRRHIGGLIVLYISLSLVVNGAQGIGRALSSQPNLSMSVVRGGQTRSWVSTPRLGTHRNDRLLAEAHSFGNVRKSSLDRLNPPRTRFTGSQCLTRYHSSRESRDVASMGHAELVNVSVHPQSSAVSTVAFASVSTTARNSYSVSLFSDETDSLNAPFVESVCTEVGFQLSAPD